MTDIKQKDKLRKDDKDSHVDVDDNIQKQRGGEVYTKSGIKDKRENEPLAKNKIIKDKFNKSNDDLSNENKKALTKSGEEYDKDNKIG
jgi:hypothetical protein